jgi:hypothetical protein
MDPFWFLAGLLVCVYQAYRGYCFVFARGLGHVDQSMFVHHCMSGTNEAQGPRGNGCVLDSLPSAGESREGQCELLGQITPL